MKALLLVKGCTPLFCRTCVIWDIFSTRSILSRSIFFTTSSFSFAVLALDHCSSILGQVLLEPNIPCPEVGKLHLSKCCFDHIFIIKNIWKDSLNTLLLLLCGLILTLSYQDEFGFVSQEMFWTKVGRVQTQITSRMLTMYGPNTDSSEPNSVSFFPSQREKWSDITSESGV